MQSKKKLINKIKKKKDEVRAASTGSFPASDPPSYWASAPDKEEQSDESEEKDSE